MERIGTTANGCRWSTVAVRPGAARRALRKQTFGDLATLEHRTGCTAPTRTRRRLPSLAAEDDKASKSRRNKPVRYGFVVLETKGRPQWINPLDA